MNRIYNPVADMWFFGRIASPVLWVSDDVNLADTFDTLTAAKKKARFILQEATTISDLNIEDEAGETIWCVFKCVSSTGKIKIVFEKPRKRVST